MKRMKRIPVAAVAAALAVQACNDSTNTSGGSLEPAELRGLAYGLANISALPTTQGAGMVTASCPEGGNATFTGSIVPDAANDNILRMDVTMNPQNCGMSAGGTALVVNGDPGVRQTGTATLGDTLLAPITLNYEITGGVGWSVASPARSGNCTLDMDLVGFIEFPDLQSTTDTLPSLEGNVSGMFCGTSVNIPLDSIQG